MIFFLLQQQSLIFLDRLNSIISTPVFDSYFILSTTKGSKAKSTATRFRTLVAKSNEMGLDMLSEPEG